MQPRASGSRSQRLVPQASTALVGPNAQDTAAALAATAAVGLKGGASLMKVIDDDAGLLGYVDVGA